MNEKPVTISVLSVVVTKFEGYYGCTFMNHMGMQSGTGRMTLEELLKWIANQVEHDVTRNA